MAPEHSPNAFVLVHNACNPKILAEAQAKYPKKAGKDEWHHVRPKYLGGPENGKKVKIDAAYHQVITNKFRSLYAYGQPKPSPEYVDDLMDQVYSAIPI